MGAPVIGAIAGGALSYLGAREQASAVESANAANVAEQRRAQEYHESVVGPGVDYAQTAFASGVPQQYIQPQYDAAGYSAGLGRYYAEQAIPEYERGRRLEDVATREAHARLGVTPESIARGQVGIADIYRNPYRQRVIDAGRSAVAADYDERARQQAASSASRGQLGSTLAAHREAAVEGARADAIARYEAEQEAAAYNAALDRATAAQQRGLDVRGAAAQSLAQQGVGVVTRGTDLAGRAVSAGEQAGRLGLEAAYAPAREYLTTVQSPAASRPTVTTPQPSGINPLAYGAGIGLQTYYDLANQGN